MDAQFTTIIVPTGRRGSRHNLEDIEFSASSHTNDDLYHKSCQHHKERISTYDKIVQEMSKDNGDSFGTSLLSILGGGDTNLICTSTSPDINTTDGGTLTLQPSGGIHFKRRRSLKLDLPYASLHLPLETKDISTRGSSPSVKSPHQLLDFVEKFNQQEDENICPDDFFSYRDLQSAELKTELAERVDYQNNQVSFDTSLQESENKINDMNYICLENQCKNPAHNHTVDNELEICPSTLTQLVAPISTISSLLNVVDNKQEMWPNSLAQIVDPLSIISSPLDVDNKQEIWPNTLAQIVDPLSTISSPLDVVDSKQEMWPNTLAQIVDPLTTSPLDVSSLKNKEANTSVSNTSEIPQLPKVKLPNISISSVANNPNTLNLISKVRRISLTNINSPTNSINLKDEEYFTVSAMSSISNDVSLEGSESNIATSLNNSTSIQPIPKTRGRRLSDSLLGLFNGIFDSSPNQSCSSPNQSLSERNEHIKEMAEISMIFRY